MNRCLFWTVVAVAFILLFCWVDLAQAQDAAGTAEQMRRVLAYGGVPNPPAGDVEEILGYWRAAQNLQSGEADRVAAFRNMYALYAKLRGRDMTGREASLMPLALAAASVVKNGGRMTLALPSPQGTPGGKYLHVQTSGTGPANLLLIGDAGTDARKIYGSFVERNKGRYTMHVVTLPWAPPAKPLPFPEVADATQIPWLKQIEKELLQMLDARAWSKLTVIGSSAGGYFAARLALQRPQTVHKAVLVDALVNMPMRSGSNPDAPASLEERITRQRYRAPFPQMFPTVPVPEDAELRRLLDHPSPSHPTVQNWMSFAIKDEAVSKQWTFDALSAGFFVPGGWYGAEFGTTDLSADIAKLRVPTLVMSAIHDRGSLRQSNPTRSQWEEVKLRHPGLPISIVPFADTRAYISADAPREFDAALEAFLAGRKPEGIREYSAPRTSPRAAVQQWLGTARVDIIYGRPAVKGRKIWGELVPYGRVWRAGANEATTVTFSTAVTVEGHPLAAGTYSFFTIPTDKEWTVIFNRVANQWGAFNYNAEFDALRFTTKPLEMPSEEYLQYAVDVNGANTGHIVLHWEKLAISLMVEAPPLLSK